MGKREDMADLAKRVADDPSHGYSQKKPSGRWGPDFDCSSLIYAIADAVGYPVGTGNEDGKVRFTGTMLKDFKDAGFQILPFANVGLGELEVGDILLNLALHAEVYVGDGQVVGAESAENGGYSGNAGDQTGQEIVKQPVYELDKGWDYVLRPPEEAEEEDPEEASQGDQGGQEMPYPYSNTTWGGMQPSWQPRNGYGPMNTLPNMGYQNSYPQGNLGQMNGYSSANSGYYPNQQGYSQGMQQNYPQGVQGSQQLAWANGIEGARDYQLAPNSCIALFDQKDPSIEYIKSTDQQGFPNIRVFKRQEISEDMPQHGGMYGNPQEQMGGMGMQDMVSRQEFEELKEMIRNVQSMVPGGYQQGNADGQQSNGKSSGQSNARGNGNARNS